MTLAPRIEVYTQLSCNRLRGDDRYHHTQTPALLLHSTDVRDTTISLYLALDPLGPPLYPRPVGRTLPGYYNVTFPTTANDISKWEEEDPRRLPSPRCLSNPAVQAGTARLQTIMTATMGLLSALTTGWWGKFSERHGRTTVLAISTFGMFMT